MAAASADGVVVQKNLIPSSELSGFSAYEKSDFAELPPRPRSVDTPPKQGGEPEPETPQSDEVCSFQNTPRPPGLHSEQIVWGLNRWRDLLPLVPMEVGPKKI